MKDRKAEWTITLFTLVLITETILVYKSLKTEYNMLLDMMAFLLISIQVIMNVVMWLAEGTLTKMIITYLSAVLIIYASIVTYNVLN